MRGVDHHRRVDVEDVLPDSLRCDVHNQDIDAGGVVLGVHKRRRHFVAAAELELDRWRVSHRLYHGGWLLHTDMGGVRCQGPAP